MVDEILKNARGGRSYHKHLHAFKITAGKDEQSRCIIGSDGSLLL
jgi:hypothetical protein